MRRILTVLGATLVGCAGAGPGGPSERIAHPTAADALVLRIETGGGFVPPEFHFREVPGLSVYGDGRAIVSGPVPEIYPGPALPNLLEYRLTEEAIQRLLRAARDAGLFGPDRTYEFPMVADAPTTTFTVVAEGRRHRISVYALGFDEEGPGGGLPGTGLSDEEIEARRRLARFFRTAGHLESFLPADSWSGPTPYRPEAMRLLVLPPREIEDVEPGVETWPLETPLGAFGDPVPSTPDGACGVVRGEELEALLPGAQRATQITRWESEGERYELAFRPLLPDERGC